MGGFRYLEQIVDIKYPIKNGVSVQARGSRDFPLVFAIGQDEGVDAHKLFLQFRI